MDFENVRKTLMRIIVFCLDSDPSLIPAAARTYGRPHEEDARESVEGIDKDDFKFWSEKQAKRIAVCIEHAFGVEYASEVAVADANVSSLARKILISKELLTSTN